MARLYEFMLVGYILVSASRYSERSSHKSDSLEKKNLGYKTKTIFLETFVQTLKTVCDIIKQ